MDLDDFAVCIPNRTLFPIFTSNQTQDEVSRTPGLTATELHTLADLLDEVRRKHVRALPTTGPRPARTMTPFSLQRTIPPDDALAGRATSTPRTATWVCVPYLSLEAYSRLDSASGFPAKTLLQMQYSRAGKARDMQQAVCMNGGVPAGHCYHIAQLWCLVLDNCKSSDRPRVCPTEVDVGWELTHLSAAVHLLQAARDESTRRLDTKGHSAGHR